MLWGHPLEAVYWLYDFADRWQVAKRSRAWLDQSRLRRFRRLVRYAQRHSPYYADLLKRHAIDPQTCTVADFPVLTKQVVIEHFDEIVTDRRVRRADLERFVGQSSDPTHLYQDRYYVVHTSGSSGRVGYYVYNVREWIRGCSQQIRFLGGLSLRRRTAFVGATSGHFTGVSLALTGTRPINRIFFDCRAFDLNCRTTDVIASLNDFQPQVLTGYGTALYLLALEQDAGRLRIRPQKIVSSGEPLLSGSRPFIEQVFRAPLVNVYTCSEHLFMGASRPQRAGLQLLEDDLVYEFHDDHTCVTNLFNRTLPLIRYRMDDALRPMEGACGAGPFIVVQDVVGRCERPIVLLNNQQEEDFIHPLVMADLVAQYLLAFQLRIVSRSHFIVRVKLQPGIDEKQREVAHREIEQYLSKILQSKQMDKAVRFRIEEVDHLPVDPRTGKFRLIDTQDTYESLLPKRGARAA